MLARRDAALKGSLVFLFRRDSSRNSGMSQALSADQDAQDGKELS